MLANFFSRAAAAAGLVLHGHDDEAFRQRMRRCFVAVALDDGAARSPEGVVALEMSVDLLSRFYPGISFVDLGGTDACRVLIAKLKLMATRINHAIDIKVAARKATCCLVVGGTRPDLDIPTVFLGSNGWTAKLNTVHPLSSGLTNNPFGAAAAACFAVAKVFRTIFADQLTTSVLPDDPLDVNVLHCSTDIAAHEADLPDVIPLDEVRLVGLGAIGQSTAWTLARVKGLAGTLHLVDHETIDLSNLQRYVGTRQVDIDKAKTRLAAARFTQPGLKVVRHEARWGNYLRGLKHTNLPLVAVALDTARDRMALQASLPLRILNAWTQPGDLGVSRHGFLEGPCLMCLYLPDRKVAHESELVAQALGLPEMEVRGLLHLGVLVDTKLLERIATGTGVPMAKLSQFRGLPLRSFYSKAVCGTALFNNPGTGDRGALAVPMAFQSALAGVLLAAEIAAVSSGARASSVAPLTKINLLRPIGGRLTQSAVKHQSGNCICQDPIYRAEYTKKYGCDTYVP